MNGRALLVAAIASALCVLVFGVHEDSRSSHTNNWAVLVCASRYWFNYRHVANVLSMYRSVKRLGIPDSNIILMVADDMACNPRNSRPATIFNNANHQINVYGDDIEVDYRGYESTVHEPSCLAVLSRQSGYHDYWLCTLSHQVTVENFLRVLTGRHDSSVPRSKRLLTDDRSNILVYMTGHGGDGFLKFQDAEEISNHELADAFEQMWQKQRYNELMFLIDTCQAASMLRTFYSPNIVGCGSSSVSEDSLSHHLDNTIGVHIIDRWTYYALEFLERISSGSKATLQSFFSYFDPKLVMSNPQVRTDLFRRKLDKVLVTDFFGSVRTIEVQNFSTVAETFHMNTETSVKQEERCDSPPVYTIHPKELLGIPAGDRDTQKINNLQYICAIALLASITMATIRSLYSLVHL